MDPVRVADGDGVGGEVEEAGADAVFVADDDREAGTSGDKAARKNAHFPRIEHMFALWAYNCLAAIERGAAATVAEDGVPRTF